MDIEKLAKEAGMDASDDYVWSIEFPDQHVTPEDLECFAAAVRREVLEEAAKLTEDNRLVSGGNGPNFAVGWGYAIESSAKAIRALAMKK